MKKTITTMTCAALLAALALNSCKKSAPVAALTQGQTDSALLVNKTLISSGGAGYQGSNDNGATWNAFAWYNETLALKGDKSYTATQSFPATPNLTNTSTGTWSISADGKTLNLGPSTTLYTIVSISSTTLVILDPAANLLVSSNPNVRYVAEKITYNY